MYTVSIVDNRLNNNASATQPIAETYQNVLYFKEEKAAIEAFEREAKAAKISLCLLVTKKSFLFALICCPAMRLFVPRNTNIIPRTRNSNNKNEATRNHSHPSYYGRRRRFGAFSYFVFKNIV